MRLTVKVTPEHIAAGQDPANPDNNAMARSRSCPVSRAVGDALRPHVPGFLQSEMSWGFTSGGYADGGVYLKVELAGPDTNNVDGRVSSFDAHRWHSDPQHTCDPQCETRRLLYADLDPFEFEVEVTNYLGRPL